MAVNKRMKQPALGNMTRSRALLFMAVKIGLPGHLPHLEPLFH